MYTIKAVVNRSVWKNHEVIGQVSMSREDADFLNGIKGIGVYFGFTEEEHRILQNGTEKELTEAGFTA